MIQLRRTLPAIASVLALALGIGATTAIFAVVNSVLVKPLPYRDAGRLVNVWSDATQQGRPRNTISPANFRDFASMNRTLDGLEAQLRDCGVTMGTPFMALSFLALSVIPALKLTDQGLVDVDAFALVNLGAD